MNDFEYKDFFETFTDFEKKFAPQDLFVEGDASLLYSGLKACIVGSRKLSEQGRKEAECLAKTLVSNDVIVVSGLAEGIDTVAHETTINYSGKTIAVLGTPLDAAYPAKNKSLLEVIKRNHLAISQFPKRYPTRKENSLLETGPWHYSAMRQL
jgi:DNA processing protein